MIAALSEFHFLRPWWLLLLAALPVIAWAWQRAQRQRSPWTRIVDPHLLQALLDRRPVAHSRGGLALALVAVTVAVLALAGPAWRQLPQPLVRNEAAWVLAIDLSDRMRATDLAPSRLARIRFKVADLLRARDDGQVGLIAYAGDAFAVAPLTEDGATLQALLPALEPDVMPTPGQRADRAIALAQQLLRDAGFERGDVLLLTDRADPRAERAAAAALRDGVRVSVLGVGTPAGAPVPLPNGGFLQRADGEVELAALDAASLRRVADAGGGRYADLAADASDLRSLTLFEPQQIDEAEARDDDRAFARYRDEGPWLVVLLLLPLAALAFRRGWLGCVLVLLLLPTPQEAQAFDLAALWKRDDQRAWEALQREDPALARALAQDPQLRGSAAYRSEDYAAAAADFAGAGGADAQYNRGNALARAGRLEDALAAYDEALRLQPDMEDAIANRKVVEQALQQQQQQQQQDPQQDGEQNPDGEQQQQSGQQQQQQGEQGQPQQDAQQSEQQGDQQGQPQPQADTDDSSEADGDDPQSASEQQREAYEQEMERAMQEAQQGEPEDARDAQPVDPRESENRQAAEQWLRRIPDDPGGLLRAKFLREHRRRQAEGRGAE